MAGNCSFDTEYSIQKEKMKGRGAHGTGAFWRSEDPLKGFRGPSDAAGGFQKRKIRKGAHLIYETDDQRTEHGRNPGDHKAD